MFCLSLKKPDKDKKGSTNKQPEKKMPPTFEEEKLEVKIDVEPAATEEVEQEDDCELLSSDEEEK